MSNYNTQLKMQNAWTDRLRSGVLGITCLLVLGASGCVTEPELKTETDVTQNTNQEVLGLGIVLGTRGYQEVQKDLGLPSDRQTKEGQVVVIEGAAYIVKDITGQEHRIPVDQNTTIDRPAHVGDWIEAYLDDHGRAVHIRNIDEEFIAKEGSLE
ncbi:MAG: hypothetical protein O2999_14200 [Nitrospirae bacterium]|nr:hypothetical protein [Nitrospirota bacterium]MDA1305416.1 hypothetical protein [Nitrospirota bacterium]